MCGVASEEDPTAAEALGNQRVTRRPRVPREDLRVDLGAHRSSKHGEGIRLGDLRFMLAVAQLGVKRKLPLAVHCRHECPSVPVERDVHPRGRMRHRYRAVTSVVSSRLTSATRACTPSCASAHATNRQP
jgi:hypothetical protein